MKKLCEFAENDTVFVAAVHTSPARRRLYEAFGIFDGTPLTVFLIAGKKVIITAGVTKLALSADAAGEILAEKA